MCLRGLCACFLWHRIVVITCVAQTVGSAAARLPMKISRSLHQSDQCSHTLWASEWEKWHCVPVPSLPLLQGYNSERYCNYSFKDKIRLQVMKIQLDTVVVYLKTKQPPTPPQTFLHLFSFLFYFCYFKTKCSHLDKAFVCLFLLKFMFCFWQDI